MISSNPSDNSERLRILNPHQSFIVQAPAGSGKTELLIQRFLLLLSQVSAPEEILAITFTKKAANEMRVRIMRSLKECAQINNATTKQLVAQVLQKDSQEHWHLLDNPNRLRIQTIDSLNSYLTRQLPVLSHLGHPPTIADNPLFLYQEAIQEILNHLEENLAWSEAVGQLLLHLDNNPAKLQRLLVDLLAKRDQWLLYIMTNNSEDQLRHVLEQQLTLVIVETLHLLREQFPKQQAAELVALVRIAASNIKSLSPESPLALCENLNALPGITVADKHLWLGISELLLTKNFAWRKRLDKNIGFPSISLAKNPNEKLYLSDLRQRMLALIEQLSKHEEIRQLFAEISFLPDATLQQGQWQILKALTQVLKILVAQLRLIFQRHGQIDYIENAQAALFSLGNEETPTDLALTLDYQIRHILVDEFQDTAYSQYRLLEKLTAGWQPDDGRTLFVVGDPMQSIYRFREAEVGLFIRACKKGIGNVPLQPLSLSVNFRSTPRIVSWVNQHFQRIFPTFNDVATGAVCYHASIANQAISHTQETHENAIQLSLLATPAENAQAQIIAQQITAIKQRCPNDTIAILVRSRTHLEHIIPALKAANLTYRAIDIDPLSERQIIQDLHSLTRALLHPADRLAWLAILRAPWCGLDLLDLWNIAHHGADTIIYDQLCKDNILEKLSSSGKQRLMRVLPLLQKQMAERRRVRLRDWIENTWILLGGPACLYHATDLEDAAAYFKLLDMLDKGSDIINLNKLDEDINSLFAGFDSHANDSLQIMTIHGAKGLEFDHVILPHLERRVPADNKTLLAWMERPLTYDESAFLLAPIQATGDKKEAIYEYIKRQQTIKMDYETARLLYVAITRAKKQVFLLAQINKNNKGEIAAPANNTFLEKLWPTIEKNTVNTSIPAAISCAQQEQQRNKITLQRLTLQWQNPIKDLENTTSTYHQQPGISLTNHDAQYIGTVTHAILQQLAQLGPTWWQAQATENYYHYIQQHLIQLGMSPSNLPHAINSVYKAIKNTLEDARGQWILAAHTQSQSEFSITAVFAGQIKSLIIDRTFIDKQGVRWIIDYKTALPLYKNLEQFLAEEQEKYDQQMCDYHHAIKLMSNDSTIRVGLYFPMIPAWKEWEILSKPDRLAAPSP
ncbi:MAG: hypothetical protein A3E83_08575 [Gammaproteobacteria bacterium RIFCSPHIGHO2_12_FULL_41_20]|nr:MAG: hypothetical protein A3E83_08575 [Gammaproteobacteria bacterium RIFCSPHIGHO2_12_FULL_41_20]